MNRTTKPWTLVLAAALIALPAIGMAQTPPQQPPATPPSAQPPATSQPPATTPPATQPPAEKYQAQSPADHLAKAKAALNEVDTTAITGAASTKLTELKRHMASLDRATATADKSGTSTTPKTTGAKPAANWATDVAAIDQILADLTTPTMAGSPTPPTGTTGTTGSAKAAITVDDATRAKLLAVRTHITAFAAAMSGTSAPTTPKDTPTTTPPDPPMPATPPTPPPATTTPPTEPPVTTQPPTTPPATQPPATTPPATPPTDPSATAPAPEAGKVDQEASKRHLTEARDTLTQLTQLPEAAKLTGDARAQVAELITNFNELITTQTEWRATYVKVRANLTALLGAETTDQAPVTPPATGTPGAVGTSGMTTLDPKVREKLIELRNKLTAFERAAGGPGEGTPK